VSLPSRVDEAPRPSVLIKLDSLSRQMALVGTRVFWSVNSECPDWLGFRITHLTASTSTSCVQGVR
jgi:hypothetical protein